VNALLGNWHYCCLFTVLISRTKTKGAGGYTVKRERERGRYKKNVSALFLLEESF
jgi:hypothetical protein